MDQSTFCNHKKNISVNPIELSLSFLSLIHTEAHTGRHGHTLFFTYTQTCKHLHLYLLPEKSCSIQSHSEWPDGDMFTDTGLVYQSLPAFTEHLLCAWHCVVQLHFHNQPLTTCFTKRILIFVQPLLLQGIVTLCTQPGTQEGIYAEGKETGLGFFLCDWALVIHLNFPIILAAFLLSLKVYKWPPGPEILPISTLSLQTH